MNKFDELYESIITEARGPKPSFGTQDKLNFAVLINGLDSQDFYKQPFGRQLSDLKKVKKFKETAKKNAIGSKGKPTMKSVREWYKENKPTEFYASWQKDSPMYKDDSIEVWYK